MGTLETRVRWFSAAAKAEPTPTPTTPLETLTKATLTAMAKARGLNPLGTKVELIGRLSDG